MAQNLFDARTIVSLVGATAVVVVTTAVTKDILDPPPQYLKIVALVVAEVLAFMAAALVRPRTVFVFLLAPFNGLLIYASATGLNAVDNGMRKPPQQQAALFPAVDTLAWWPPTEMVKLQEAAGAATKTISETAPTIGRGSAVLKDPRLPLRDQAANLQRQLSSVPNERTKVQQRLATLAKEAEKPVHPLERDAVERRRAKDRDDLERELARLDELEKNARKSLEDVARLEAMLGDAQRLTAPFAESLEDAARKLVKASAELTEAIGSANQVTGLQK